MRRAVLWRVGPDLERTRDCAVPFPRHPEAPLSPLCHTSDGCPVNPHVEAHTRMTEDLSDAVEMFEQCRRRLFGIAYRMLGSVADAEDILQDVWIRWQSTRREDVLEPVAFLTTITTRLSINSLQSAHSRRETRPGVPQGRPHRRARRLCAVLRRGNRGADAAPGRWHTDRSHPPRRVAPAEPAPQVIESGGSSAAGRPTRAFATQHDP